MKAKPAMPFQHFGQDLLIAVIKIKNVQLCKVINLMQKVCPDSLWLHFGGFLAVKKTPEDFLKDMLQV